MSFITQLIGGRRAEHNMETEKQLIARQGLSLNRMSGLREDFLLNSGGTLPAPWVVHDTSAAGSPTKDYVDNAAGGVYSLIQANTNELEVLSMHWGDFLLVDITKKPIFEARVKLNMDTAPWSADERFVVGIGSARNSTFDSVALNAWFRIQGASLELLVESDDGTTDTDDQATGISISNDTFFTVKIDFADLRAVRFWVDLEDGRGYRSAGKTSMAAATGNAQVIIETQKSAGTETEELHIDFADFTSGRR